MKTEKTFRVYRVDWINRNRPWACQPAFTLHKSIENSKEYIKDYVKFMGRLILKHPDWPSHYESNSKPYLTNTHKTSYEYLERHLGQWIWEHPKIFASEDNECCRLEKRAERFAAHKHRNQTRKDGVMPYIVHPKAVAEIILQASITDEVSIASALLHDTVEDTDTTLEEICREFGPEVAKYVCLLTRSRGDDRDAYHERIVYAAPKEVQIIKLADVLHNIRTLDKIADAEKKEKFRNNVTHALEKYYLPLAQRISPELYGLLCKEFVKHGNSKAVNAMFPDFEAS